MSHRVLIVGIGGFLASRLARALRAVGMEVLGADRKEIRPISAGSVISKRHLFTNDKLAKVLPKIDAVYWLAGSSTPASSAGKPMLELEQNLSPFLQFLSVFQENSHCKLVFVSTGGAMYGDVREDSALEAHSVHARSYYTAGKAAAEHFISAWSAQFHGTAIILRPSNIYGPGQGFQPGFGIIPAALNAIQRAEPLVIWGDGSEIRDYLYVDDFTRLCTRILDHTPGSRLLTMHASSGVGVSLNQLLSEIESVTGARLIRKYMSSRSVDVSRVVLDNGRARTEMGWQPRTELREGLTEAWRWFKSKGI